MSQDGSQMVYEANRRLYRRLMSELDARPIPGTESQQSISSPVFSPDGRNAAFESTRGGMTGVYLMPALGGSPTRVTPPGRQYVLAGWRGPTGAS